MIKGSSGVWGETAMPAHPDLPESDARQIAAWIQSLAGGDKVQKSLPAQGSVQPTLNKPARDNGVLYLTASYTDKGGNNIKPLTGQTTVGLKSNKVTFEEVANRKGFERIQYEGNTYMIVPKTTGWFSIDSIDLTGIKTAVISAGWQEGPEFGYAFELRLDSPDGKKLGEVTLDGVKGQKNGSKQLKLTLEPVADGKLHNLYIVSKVKDPKEPNTAGLQSIQFGIK
jgi:cytochrome c